ncbi:thiamine pyrophosphate-binding protein [Pseudochelatococcus lubricantis]|uniref:thiamine pyrophosphate-binding protein n=1 Tax=Pseudochelatococcus lubricantis TaxID=1538102 RepID=UPI0031B5CF3D
MPAESKRYMMRNGGQLVVECLPALGATKSFGVPGGSYLAVIDAPYDRAGERDHVLCHNEGRAIRAAMRDSAS